MKCNNQFIFKNHTFNYITNVLNTNQDKTERIVELPIMEYFLNNYINPNTIEIGCVSPYYFNTSHKIFDLTDPHPRCTKKNAFDVDLTNSYLLSISTVEHFGLSDYNINNIVFFDPYMWILLAIKKCNKFLITYPLGYNKKLDNKILNSSLDIDILCRIPGTSHWIEKNKSELTEYDLTYDFSFNTCANSIIIIQNIIL
jgi:hypothetical protein